MRSKGMSDNTGIKWGDKMRWNGTGWGTDLLLYQVLLQLEPLTCNCSCKLLILTSLSYLTMIVMFVCFFLQNVAHSMTVNPVLSNHGEATAMLTEVNFCIYLFVSVCVQQQSAMR